MQEAPRRCLEAKGEIEAGKDPCADKQAAREVRRRKVVGTFEAVAREWHGQRKRKLDPVYAGRILRFLERDIFPEIGAMDVTEIEPSTHLKAIRRVDAGGTQELPGRLLRYCIKSSAMP